jgi:phosphate transport system substrate-binding protein
MKRITIFALIAATTIAVFWFTLPGALDAEEKLAYSCSAQIFEAFEAERLNAFTKATGIEVELYIASSAICMNRLINGLSDIASTTRSLHFEHKESGYMETPFCRDPLAVIVNSKSAVSTLSKKQVREIFMGDIENWNQLIGPDQPIVLVIPSKKTGAYKNFHRLVMMHRDIRYDFTAYKSTNVINAVRYIPGAISFISHGAIASHKEIKAIKIDGIPLTHKDYPLSQIFSFITRGKPIGPAKKFIDFAFSGDGKAIMVNRGMSPIQ